MKTLVWWPADTVSLIALLAVSGCGMFLGNPLASDGTERGLSYIAGAIVTAAVIRAFFNK